MVIICHGFRYVPEEKVMLEDVLIAVEDEVGNE